MAEPQIAVPISHPTDQAHARRGTVLDELGALADRFHAEADIMLRGTDYDPEFVGAYRSVVTALYEAGMTGRQERAEEQMLAIRVAEIESYGLISPGTPEWTPSGPISMSNRV